MIAAYVHECAPFRFNIGCSLQFLRVIDCCWSMIEALVKSSAVEKQGSGIAVVPLRKESENFRCAFTADYCLA